MMQFSDLTSRFSLVDRFGAVFISNNTALSIDKTTNNRDLLLTYQLSQLFTAFTLFTQSYARCIIDAALKATLITWIEI